MILTWALQMFKKIKTERRFKSKSKFKIKTKPFQSVFPFLALLTFTFIFAGIYYEIEINYCPTEWGSLTYYSNSSMDLTYWKAFHFIATIESTIGNPPVGYCTTNLIHCSSLFQVLGTLCRALFGAN